MWGPHSGVDQLGFGRNMLISTSAKPVQALIQSEERRCLLASALITAVSVVSSSLSYRGAEGTACRSVPL